MTQQHRDCVNVTERQMGNNLFFTTREVFLIPNLEAARVPLWRKTATVIIFRYIAGLKKKNKSAIEKYSLHNSISLPLEITSHNRDLSWNIFSQRQDSPFHKSTYQDSFLSGSLLIRHKQFQEKKKKIKAAFQQTLEIINPYFFFSIYLKGMP